MMHGVGLSSSSAGGAAKAARRGMPGGAAGGAAGNTPGGTSSGAVGGAAGSAAPPAETTREGLCPTAARLAKAQIAKWEPDSNVWGRLSAMYGEQIYSRLMTTGAADALFARACHRMLPPCAAGGACVEAALAARVWRDADRFYCARFGGADGGRDASRLAMLPLLQDLVHRLEAAAAGDAERLLLFSGHDTVLAPVVAALGGAKAPSLCRWPPYASRLVFEVWRAEKPRRGKNQTDYVRVLFNGRAITQHLNGCRSRLPHSSSGLSHELCPLSALAKAVRLIAQEFATACPSLARAT